MMLYFDNLRLIDPEAGTDVAGTLLVRDGVIAARDVACPAGAQVVDGQGACLAPGLVDWGVLVGEPGALHLESLRSASAAAAAGGVTTMVIRPDTDPSIDTPEVLDYVTRRAESRAQVRVHAMAALTRARAGREMAEIGFLRDAGAVAFGDGDRVVQDTRVLARAMTYARGLNALVVGHPQDPGLSRGACATSGKVASLMGLPAVPPMAERMGLERDLALVELTKARYHADCITTEAALAPLRAAKARGLDVSAGVSIHHLALNDLDLGAYRTFFKFTPPLRTEDDRRAIVQAVADGLIDVIASFHTPADEESKRLPFEDAAPGAVGLQTFLPVLMRLHHSDGLPLPLLWRAAALNPARRLGLPVGRLNIGAPADLVLFDPDAPFVLDRFSLLSKAKNTPFDGARMEGQVRATYVAGVQVHGGELLHA